MNLKRFGLALGTIALFGGAPAHATSSKGLLPFSGSYTGTAISTTAAGSISGNATLTFTGKAKSLRGAFLYTGILNSGNLPLNFQQTFTISNRGILSGRVTLDGVDGTGNGQAQLRGKKLTVSMTYTVGVAPGTTISVNGVIVFKGRMAAWNAVVNSSDPNFAGSLVVTGKR